MVQNPNPALCSLVVLLAAGSAGAGHAADLKSPFAATGPTPISSQPFSRCPIAPPALTDLDIRTVYVDKDFKIADPARAKERQAKVAVLRGFLGQAEYLARSAITAEASARPGIRACFNAYVGAWARAKALLGEVSEPEGAYERKWLLTNLSLAYMAANAGLPTIPEPPADIRDWLEAMAEHVAAEYSTASPKRNNHYYWAALALVSAGTVLQRQDYYAWGVHEFEGALAAVDGGGFLPLELQRGKYALHYHAFSLSPLVMIAAFVGANGGAPYRLSDGALSRLADRTIDGLSDPSAFAAKAGEAQVFNPPGPGAELPWLEPYYAATKDAKAEPWLRSLRPFKTIWLGGVMSEVYNSPLPPGVNAQSVIPVQ